MANSIAKLAILLTADSSGLTKGFAQAKADVNTFAADMQAKAAQVAAIAIGAGVGFVGWGVKLAAEAETAKVGFEVLLGSAGKAQLMIKQINELSRNSSFGKGELGRAMTTMLAGNVGESDAIPMLRAIGDISMGSAEKMQSLALAFSQTTGSGRLMGQEVLQMVNAGFNPLAEISRKTGVSMAELKKQMEAGGISVQMVRDAFVSATSAGGRFYQMGEKINQTLQGKWNQLGKDAKELATQVGEFVAPALSKVLEVGKGLLEWIKSFDAASVKLALQITAGVATFIAVINIIPKVVAAYQAFVAAIRLVTSAEITRLAFSGPKGWAQLAAGAAIATAAVVGLGYVYDQLTAKQQQSAAAAQKVADEAAKASNIPTAKPPAIEGPDFANDGGRAFDQLREKGNELAKSLQSPFAAAREKMDELNMMVSAGAISWELYQQAVNRVSQELADATEARQEFEKPASVGAADRYTTAGFAAVQNARANMDHDRAAKELAAKQLAANQQQVELQKGMLQALKQPPKGADMKVVERI